MTNQSFAGKRSFRTILTIVIAIMLLVTVFAGTASAKTTDEYTVNIVDGSTSVAVTTNETEPIEILKSAGITVSAGDKLDISDFAESQGGIITVNRLNTVYVEFDGNITAYQVYSHTIGDAFASLGIGVTNSDQINYSLNTEITDGMVIKVYSSPYVTLKADGKETKYALTDGTVADLLKTAGVTLGDDDYTEPSVDSKLKKGLVVKVKRVEYKLEEKTETVKYSTVEKKDTSLKKGETKVLTEGEDGEAEVTYQVKYVNGKKKDSAEVSRTVTKKAIQKQIAVGADKEDNKDSDKEDKEDKDSTNEVEPNGVKSKNGYKLGQVIKGKYSHYCACAICNGNSRGVTSSGIKIKNGMDDPYYVACNWLPLGSVINVDGTNYTVVDRGGSGLSRKGRIDIFTPGGHSECYKLGVGSCSIEIVRLGW